MVLQLFLCVFGHRFIKRYFILNLFSQLVPHSLYIFLFQKEATSSLGPFSLETVFPPLPFSKEKGAWDAVEKEIKNEGIFFYAHFLRVSFISNLLFECLSFMLAQRCNKKGETFDLHFQSFELVEYSIHSHPTFFL